MKLYLPQEENRIGGGWTFLRNLHKGIAPLCEIVNNLREAEVFLIPGVTMIDRDDVELAHSMHKPIVLRVDNIPRKSRNKRSRVLDNLKRYAEIADAVIYQSEWAKDYCRPMTGDGLVIRNGVDQNIFFPASNKPDHPRYLFAFHGKNEIKGYWIAHYLFQCYHRENPSSEFWFIYNFKSELQEQLDANFDFWNGEKFKHLEPVDKPEEMAAVLRQCTHLIYPAYCDAAPNMVLEARACGLQIVGMLDPAWSGVAEMLDPQLDISLERMAREYLVALQWTIEQHNRKKP